MKKLALPMIAALMMSGAAMAETVKVGVDTGAYPPFTIPAADGSWSGWEIDFMNAICAEAKLDCVITPTAWDGIIPALTGGQIDVIMSSMSITAERSKVIDFSDKYYNTPTVVIAGKGLVASPDPAGLAGKVIGVQVSTTQEAYAMKYFAPEGAEVKSYQTADEVNQDLASGRIDAIVIDALPGGEFLKTEEGTACCENVGLVLDDEEILGKGVGFGLRKDDPLKEKLNAAIAAIRANGTYDEISKRYFDFDIYGQ